MMQLDLENPPDLLERVCAGMPIPPDAPEGILRDALAAMIGLCRDIEVYDFIDEDGHNATSLRAYRRAIDALDVLRLWPAPELDEGIQDEG